MNRWCIIAGARSGSTWLEEMIWLGFPKGHYYMKLGEPLEHSAAYISSSKHNVGVRLNEAGYVTVGKSNTDDVAISKEEHYKKTYNTIAAGDRKQPVVMKIFCQDWKYSEAEYTQFLGMLQRVGYKFISLERNIVDRAISWWVMEHTKKVHRWRQGEKLVYSTPESFDEQGYPSDKITIDTRTWSDYYALTAKEDSAKSRILQKFNHVTVNYETLIDDCLKNNIPIWQYTSIQKTYDQEYKYMISNYDELENFIHSEEFRETYGIKDIVRPKIADTVCQFAWDYPVIQIARNDLRNCCRAVADPVTEKDLDLGSRVFTEFGPIVKQRRELLQGIKTEACRSCWAVEERGARSPRTGFDRFAGWVKQNLWKTIPITEVKEKLSNLSESEIEEIVKIDSPRMIEISLGNTCDLKCVYCNHHYSSQWASEKLRYKEIPLIDVERPLSETDSKFEQAWWEWFETSAAGKINTINFIGGEPLLIEKFHTYTNRILDFYDNNPSSKSIDISVVTNFNTPKKQFEKFLAITKRIIEKDNFKLDFNISMESIGSRAEFIRNGTNWELMTSNLQKFINFVNEHDTSEPPKVAINLQIALNSLCISDLPNFFQFVIDLQQRNTQRPINLRQNQVVYPQWTSAFILPETYSQYIDQSIELLMRVGLDHSKYTREGRWDSYIKFLYSVKNGITYPEKDNKIRKEFAKQIDQLCERRKLNFEETFPEMVDFYNECVAI
jgi:organic radical activating enzyme